MFFGVKLSAAQPIHLTTSDPFPPHSGSVLNPLFQTGGFPYPDSSGWLAFVAFSVFVFISATQSRAIWAGARRWLEPQRWWPWSASSWRSYVRSLPLITASCVLMVASFLVEGALATFTEIGAVIVMGLGGLLTLVSFVVALWVGLCGRPERLVPPPLRTMVEAD